MKSGILQPQKRIPIAVKFNMVREDLPIVEKFRLLKEIGFDGVEVSVRDRKSVSDFAEAAVQSKLPVHGVVNSSDPDISSAVRMAADLGADSVLLVAEQKAGLCYDQNFGHWLNQIREAIPLAEKMQISLLVENVRATFLKTAEEMSRFIDLSDSPIVGAYYDTGNTITWTDQSAEHWAKTLGSRIRKIDVKDRGHSEFGDAKLRSLTAQGTDGGEVHWENVRRELDDVSFTGWATAEVRGGDRERLAGIATWMKSVLGIFDAKNSG